MTAQQGYGKMTNSLPEYVQSPDCTEVYKVFRDSSDGNWYTKTSTGVVARFEPSIGTLKLIAFDASVNLFPAAGAGSGVAGAIKKGDTFYVTVAGVIAGINVRVNHLLVAIVDTPGQTVGNWSIISNTQTKVENILFAAGDETTPIAVLVDAVTFRMPYASKILGVRTSLATGQVAGDLVTVDIKHFNTGVSIFTTTPTIDNGEKTSTTAAIPAVIDAANNTFVDDEEVSINISQVGAATVAAGLKVEILFSRETA